ncbi:unnamed protein product [Malus baccata var. baccata]
MQVDRDELFEVDAMREIIGNDKGKNLAMECALLEDNASNLSWGDLLQGVLPNSDGGDNNSVQGGGGAVRALNYH